MWKEVESRSILGVRYDSANFLFILKTNHIIQGACWKTFLSNDGVGSERDTNGHDEQRR